MDSSDFDPNREYEIIAKKRSYKNSPILLKCLITYWHVKFLWLTISLLVHVLTIYSHIELFSTLYLCCLLYLLDTDLLALMMLIVNLSLLPLVVDLKGKLKIFYWMTVAIVFLPQLFFLTGITLGYAYIWLILPFLSLVFLFGYKEKQIEQKIGAKYFIEMMLVLEAFFLVALEFAVAATVQLIFRSSYVDALRDDWNQRKVKEYFSREYTQVLSYMSYIS